MPMSRAKALSKDSKVTRSRGFKSAFIISMMRFPARGIRASLAGSRARIVPLPGKASPTASKRQFMELAVNIPAQEPHEGQAASSRTFNWASVIWSACTLPTPSKRLIRSSLVPSGAVPASIGPPVRNNVGMFTRKAPMIMPGVILSQLVRQTRPSKQWALAMVSMESAISSRLASE